MSDPTPQLLPEERVALTVALAQVLRNERPTPNVGLMCVLALARITGRHDWTKREAIADSQAIATAVRP